MENLRTRLENLKGENSLKDSVIEIALNHIEEYDTVGGYFEYVLYAGCQSGAVGELIYYYQTEKFFNEHHAEIFEIYNDYQADGLIYGFELSKNNLAWFGFEETLRSIAYDLDLEF